MENFVTYCKNAQMTFQAVNYRDAASQRLGIESLDAKQGTYEVFFIKVHKESDKSNGQIFKGSVTAPIAEQCLTWDENYSLTEVKG